MPLFEHSAGVTIIGGTFVDISGFHPGHDGHASVLDLLKSRTATHVNDEINEAQVTQYDGDALDDVNDGKTKKRIAPASKSKSTRKKRQKIADFDDGGLGKFGVVEVVKVTENASGTGRASPGRVSQNTLEFLVKLKDPKCNNREWFKLHDSVYRLAEQEWKDFVDMFNKVLMRVDPQVASFPARALIHRIYSRFKNDNMPYKTRFSAGFSKLGIKPHCAGFHPGNKSNIRGGLWNLGPNELAAVRSNIQYNSTCLWDVISTPEFVKYFGEPKPCPDGGRQNMFGMKDELKIAPKGIDKEHKDIAFLKCRTFNVVYMFKDEEVLAPDFKDKMADVARVMRPFVHCLNGLLTMNEGGDSI